MAHDDGSGSRLDAPLVPGSQLVWRMLAAETAGLGAIVDAYNLGTWAATPIGLGAEAYFDLELERPVSLVTLVLIVGRLPDWHC